MATDIMVPNPLRDKILNRAKAGTIAQFKVKGDIVYQEEMTTFKKAYVILDMFKDFGIGCGMPENLTIDPIIIPLPHMTPEAMEALIRWCYHHKEDPDMTVEELNDNLYHCTGEIKDSWDVELYESLDDDTLFDLLVAAKYLGVPEMRDSLTTYIANCIVQGAEEAEQGKTTEEEPSQAEGATTSSADAKSGVQSPKSKADETTKDASTSSAEKGTGDKSGPSDSGK